MHHDDATPNGPVQAGTPSRARAIVMREVFKHRATAETLSPAAILARTSSRCAGVRSGANYSRSATSPSIAENI